MPPEAKNLDTASRQAVLTTLLFTDIVGSTALKQSLGDQQAIPLLIQHHQLLRSILAQFPQAQEIETAGDSFFIQFPKPSDAVRFALLLTHRLGQRNQTAGAKLLDRIGIHLGEVTVEDRGDSEKARGFYGIQVDACARVMSLAQGGQILMTRAVFDNARQALKGTDLAEVGATTWVSHGLYSFKGLEEPLEVCEARLASVGPPVPPASTDKATRASLGPEEVVIGWRPVAGEKVRGTPWVLKEKLGEGGFGEAWLGEHEAMKEKRVFKFCFRADRVRALKREVALFRLMREKVEDHPHLVKMLDVFLEEPPYHLVEEYVPGKDLQTWCRAQGWMERISLETRLEIVAQVADGLQAAHEAGVLHRDIKPGNILMQGKLRDSATLTEQQSPAAQLLAPIRQKLAERGASSAEERSARWRESGMTLWEIGQHLRAKLADFGIGQVISQECLAGMTRAGISVTAASAGTALTGTHLYMAPEVVAGKGASPRSDVYSLGVVLYQFLVGDFKQPVGTGWEEDIPDDLLREDLHQCLARNPKDRFATAAQLAKQLRSYKTRREEMEQRQAEQEERQASAYWRGVVITGAVALVLLVAVAGLAIYALWGSSRAAPWKVAARANAVAAGLQRYERAIKSQNLPYASSELLHLWRFLASTYARNPTAPANAWESEFDALLAQLDAKDLSPAWQSREAVVERLGYYWNPKLQREALTVVSRQLAMRLIGILNHQRAGLIPAGVLSGAQETALIYRTPDGQWEIQGDSQAVSFKNLATGALLQSSNQWGMWVNGSKSRPPRLAAKIEPEGVLVRDLATRKTLCTLHLPQPTPKRVVFSPDAKRAAVLLRSQHFQIFELPSGKPLTGVINPGHEISPRTFLGVTIRGAEFSPDGQLFLTVSDQGVRGWDAAVGTARFEFMAADRVFGGAEFSPDGRRVVASSGLQGLQKRFVVVLDQANGRPLTDHIPAIGYWLSRDGQLLITYAESTQVWNLETGKLIATIPGEPQDFNPTGEGILAVSENSAQVCDLRTGQPLTQPMIHRDRVSAATYSPNNRWIATTAWDGTARIWDAATGRPHTGWLQLAVDRKAADLRSTPTFSQCSRFLALTSAEYAMLWEVEPGRPLTCAFRHPRVNGCQVSPDGRWIVTVSASGSRGRTMKIWNVNQLGTNGPAWQLDTRAQAAEFSPTEDRVATASGRVARLWDAVSGQPLLAEMGHPHPVSLIRFSPNGQRLATASSNQVQVWEVKSAQALGQPILCEGTIREIAFGPSGDVLLTWAGNQLRLWEVPSGKSVSAPLEVKGKVKGACLGADGRWVAAAGPGNLATLWNWKSESPVTLALDSDQEVNWVGLVGPNHFVTLSPFSANLWEVDSYRHAGSVASEKSFVSAHQVGDDLVLDAGMDIIRIFASPRYSFSVEQSRKTYPEEAVRAVARPPGDTLLLMGAPDGTIWLYNEFSFNRSWHRDHFGGWIEASYLSDPVLIAPAQAGQLIAAGLSYDQRRALTLSADGVVRIWPVPFQPKQIPKWFLEFFYAYNSDLSFPQLRRRLEEAPANDEFTRWGRWFFRLGERF